MASAIKVVDMGLLNKHPYELDFSDLKEFFEVSPPQTEGIFLEFKKIWPMRQTGPDNDSIAQAVAAFANTMGGWLIIGIDEQREGGKTTGKAIWPPHRIDHDPAIEARVQNVVKDNVFPYVSIAAKPLEIPDKPGKMVVAIRVPEGDLAPYFTRDEDGGAQVYVRRAIGKDNLWKEEPLATERELELLFGKRARLETMLQYYISPAQSRSYVAGIERTYPILTGTKLRPVIHVCCIPKSAASNMFSYEELESVLEAQDIRWPGQLASWLIWHPTVSNHKRMTQTDSELRVIAGPPVGVAEFSRNGLVAYSSNPMIIQGDKFLVHADYIIFATIWPVLFASKIASFSRNHELSIRMNAFGGSSFISSAFGSQGAAISTEEEVLIQEEFIPKWDKDELIEIGRRLSLHLARGLDLAGCQGELERLFETYVSAAFPT